MPHSPPADLVALLERLGLATSGQVESVAPAVRRLAGELPPFESVWIDALAQRRLLTPYQAAQLIAGHGDNLQIGPYIVRAKLSTPTWATAYGVQNRQTRARAELLFVHCPANTRASLVRDVERLIQQTQLMTDARLLGIIDVGQTDHGVWIAANGSQGRTAADWIVQHGRFPPKAVKHIARQLLEALIQLQKFELLHTGLSAQAVIIHDGAVHLRHPGVRGLVRPCEGYALSELPPSAYDGVSPERVAEAEPCTLASEMFAFGCLIWHLMTGRPTFAGGNALTKLRLIHDARLPDLRQLVPDAPSELIELANRCLQKQPEQRPKSWDELLVLLGPAETAERETLVRSMDHPQSLYRRTSNSKRPRHLRAAACVAAATACFFLVAISQWPAKSTTATLLIPRQPVALNLLPTKSADRAVKPGYDSQVRLASAHESIPDASSAGESASGEAPPPLILPADRILELIELDLQTNQTVQPERGSRAIVRVPRDGLLISAERVRFENIDFVWDPQTPTARGDSSAPAALLVIAASRCEFRHCTFQVVPQAPPPIAITWQNSPPSSPQLNTHDGVGELVLSSCHFFGLEAVVQIERTRSGTVDISNTLVNQCGAVTRLDAFPALGSAVSVMLEHTTLRETGPVCAIASEAAPAQPGQVIVQSGSSVLSLRDGDPLLCLTGSAPSATLLSFIRWNGEGSLMPTETTIAAWQRPGGLTRALDESLLPISGLVRGEAEFASENPGVAASSRLASWQAPLRSMRPPGISGGLPDLPRLP